MKAYEKFHLIKAAVETARAASVTRGRILMALIKDLEEATGNYESSMLIAALTEAVRDVQDLISNQQPDVAGDLRLIIESSQEHAWRTHGDALVAEKWPWVAVARRALKLLIE